jgi:hypothetical protein
MTYTAGADGGLSTNVSSPGSPIGGGTSAVTGAPGATGPLNNQISVAGAAGITLGTAAVGLLALGVLFRRGGQKLPPVRVDAVNAINVYFSWLLIDATLKIAAYHWHGHKVAQAYLLIA